MISYHPMKRNPSLLISPQVTGWSETESAATEICRQPKSTQPKSVQVACFSETDCRPVLCKNTQMASSSSAADEPEVMPELPSELIVVVLLHLPIRAMRTASLVCRAYCTAARVDDVWKSVLQRRWSLDSLDAFGAKFGSWNALFHALRQLKPTRLNNLSSASRAALRDGALISVHGLEPPACCFLVGVAMGGLFPTADGLFTHHEDGASPIHYRHSLSAAESAALDEYDASRVRLGGSWEWSCDRAEWFPCSTTSITRGVFSAAGEWDLADSNLEIVDYLHDWPVVPLVLRECALAPNTASDDDAFWCMAHADVCKANEQQVVALGAAIISREPTTPCVELRAITTHFFLQPVRHIRPQVWAWEPLYQSAAQRSVCEAAQALCGADVLNQYAPNMAPHRLFPFKPYEFARACDLRLRGELGIRTEEEEREYVQYVQRLENAHPAAQFLAQVGTLDQM